MRRRSGAAGFFALSPSWRYLALAGVSLACAACADSTAPLILTSSGEVRPEMVTGAAAAALGSDGIFRLAPPQLSLDEISLDSAREQSLQFAKYATNHLLLRGVIENGRGGYWTDPHLLTLCPQNAHFVRPQLQSIPGETLPPAGHEFLRRRFGPFWLIALCGAKNEPQMTVQVAVDGNSIRFRNNKPAEPYFALSWAYWGDGVPMGWPDALPVSAERAVRFVYDQLGVPISGVPELYSRGGVESGFFREFQIGAARNCNRWRIVLDRDVSLRGRNSQVAQLVRDVWVGAFTCDGWDVTPVLQLPMSAQPEVVTLAYDVRPPVPLLVRVPTASPIRFELADRSPQ